METALGDSGDATANNISHTSEHLASDAALARLTGESELEAVESEQTAATAKLDHRTKVLARAVAAFVGDQGALERTALGVAADADAAIEGMRTQVAEESGSSTTNREALRAFFKGVSLDLLTNVAQEVHAEIEGMRTQVAEESGSSTTNREEPLSS